MTGREKYSVQGWFNMSTDIKGHERIRLVH